MRNERRLQRSGNPTVALRYQMDVSLAQSSVTALVVADESGMVLATTGESVLAEEVAGYLAIRRQKAFEGKVRAAGRAWEVVMHRMLVDGVGVLIAAIGGSKHERDVALAELATGTRRILGTTRAVA